MSRLLSTQAGQTQTRGKGSGKSRPADSGRSRRGKTRQDKTRQDKTGTHSGTARLAVRGGVYCPRLQLPSRCMKPRTPYLQGGGEGGGGSDAFFVGIDVGKSTQSEEPNQKTARAVHTNVAKLGCSIKQTQPTPCYLLLCKQDLQ
jgi:hypothetical protein